MRTCELVALTLKMANGSTVLRNIFGFFNLLFAIVGALIIILAIVAHVHISKLQELDNLGAVILLYVIGFITLSISFLGAYGAFRQVKWMLVVFLVLMCIGFLFLIRFAVVTATVRPKVSQYVEDQMNNVLPLDKTSDELKEFMDGFQMSMHCCGLLNGYSDWNDNVPESCNCTPTEELTSDVCVALPGYSFERLFSHPAASGRLVYSQSCGPIIINFVTIVFDAATGVFIALTILTVLGIAISSCVIAQINRNRNAAVVLAPALMFSPSPPKYNELVNEPYPSSYMPQRA